MSVELFSLREHLLPVACAVLLRVGHLGLQFQRLGVCQVAPDGQVRVAEYPCR